MLKTGNYELKKPEGSDPVDVQDFNENADIIDAELKKRPTSTGNASEMTSTFVQAGTRANLVSGEAVKTSFGKVMKWFADLKYAAFADVANNDSTTAGGYVADARVVKAHGDEIDALNENLTKLSTSVDSSNNAFTQQINTINTDLTAILDISTGCAIRILGPSKENNVVYGCYDPGIYTIYGTEAGLPIKNYLGYILTLRENKGFIVKVLVLINCYMYILSQNSDGTVISNWSSLR